MSDMTFTKSQKREAGHSRPRPLALICLAMLMTTAPPLLAQAQTREGAGEGRVVTIEGTRIQGEQELPTVLYLVPWQPVNSRGPEPMERQLMTGETPEPLEREAFRRQLDYHQTRLEQRSRNTQE